MHLPKNGQIANRVFCWSSGCQINNKLEPTYTFMSLSHHISLTRIFKAMTSISHLPSKFHATSLLYNPTQKSIRHFHKILKYNFQYHIIGNRHQNTYVDSVAVPQSLPYISLAHPYQNLRFPLVTDVI